LSSPKTQYFDHWLMVNNLVLWHEKSGQIGEKRLADIQCLYLIPERLQTG